MRDEAPPTLCLCGRPLRIEQGDGRLYVVCRCSVRLEIQPRGRWTDPQTKAEGPACYVCEGVGMVAGRKVTAQKIATTAERAVRFWVSVVSQPVGGFDAR